MLEAGIKGTGSVEVVRENTAAAVGSGMLEVFATPMMAGQVLIRGLKNLPNITGLYLPVKTE